jgi:nucleoside-diphosphate-sugar epimerase
MSTPERSALVTGATGALGVPLVRSLITAGYQVTALARRPAPPGLLPPTVRQVACDVRAEADVAAAIPAGGLVVHLAGRKRGRGRAAFDINVDGTAALLRAARGAGAVRVVVASSIHIYGRTEPGAVADETTRPAPHSRYGASKLAAEQAARTVAERWEAPTLVILRIAAAYPGAGGNLERLERTVARSGPVTVVPWTDAVRTLVHVEDVAAAVLLVGTHTAAAGETLNVTDGQVRTIREIVTALAVAAGRPVPWLRVPRPRHDLAVDGGRIQALLGFSPAFDLGSAAAVES